MNEQHIEEMINTLYDYIQDAKALPLGADRCILEREKALDMLDEIIASMPADLKQARTIVESRNELISQARREAENTIRQAQEQAKQLVTKEAIYVEAKRRSEELVMQTQNRINQIQKAGNSYMDESLRQTEEAIAKAEELHASMPGSIIAGQFDNPVNPDAHYRTTGPEIWDDTDGTVDIFIAGVGTGGTLSGTGRYLKEQNPDVTVIAVEPYDSPLLSKGTAGPHGLHGIGANFIPANLDRSIYDEIITVKTEEAFAAAKLLAKKDGILAGISSGAALHAAITVAQRPENADKTIVVLLPDTGDRYLSTGMFDD